MSDMSVKEAYKVLHDACGIEVGDEVTVLRIPVNGKELGWNHPGYGCVEDRIDLIGKTAKISQVNERHFYFEGDTTKLGWPFFCLELAKETKPDLPDGVTFTADGLKVGGVYLSKDTIRRNLDL